MTTGDITSGELLYRINNLHDVDLLPTDTIISNQLRQFLDIHGKEQVKRREKQLSLTLALRPSTLESYSRKVKHLSERSIPLIQAHKQCILSEVVKETSYTSALLHENAKQFEAKALESTLQYFSVLKQEIESASQQLQSERMEKESLKRQAKVARDIMLFNQHLRMESRKRIELSLLHPESAQFQRCVRAIHDNLNESFGLMLKPKMKLTPKDVRIINVFKLKNEILAKPLQDQTAKMKNAKLKGLFCCLPAEAVYSFTVHGIADQQVPIVVQDALAEQKTPEALSSSWLFANENPLLPLPEELQNVHNIAGAAQKLANRGTDKPHIRFSRFSTISSVAHYSEKQLEKGVLLALCRVLIVKQKTVNGFVEESNILDAYSNGYDAVMSSLNEEYVLLNPKFVVPEFLIHVFFPTVLQQQTNKLIIGQKGDSSIPDLLIPNEEVKKDIQWEKQLFLNSSVKGHCSAENILIGNDLHQKEDLHKDENSSTKPQNDFNSQRNVVIKQTALLSIEQAAEEFTGLKATILKQMTDRVANVVKSKMVRVDPMTDI